MQRRPSSTLPRRVAPCDTPAGLGLDAQQHGLVLPVDGRDRLEGKNAPLPEPSAYDDLIGIVGVTLVANVIEAPAAAPLLVQDEVALGRGKQPAKLALLSQLNLGACSRSANATASGRRAAGSLSPSSVGRHRRSAGIHTSAP
jgi:hypothetical protein